VSAASEHAIWDPVETLPREELEGIWPKAMRERP